MMVPLFAGATVPATVYCRGAAQLTGAPVLAPAHVHVKFVAVSITVGRDASTQRLAVGALTVATALALPQLPAVTAPKLAVTARLLATLARVHAPAPEHAPLQLTKTKPVFAVAVQLLLLPLVTGLVQLIVPLEVGETPPVTVKP